MRHPISLLCLSDLHFEAESDMSHIGRFGADLYNYVSNPERQKWKPDFIVIPGDIVNHGNEYDDADDVIQTIANKFSIPLENVIVVPGNHDKEGPKNLDEVNAGRTAFDNYCKDCTDTSNKNDFSKVFRAQFDKFLKFSEKFNSNLVKPSDTLLEPGLGALAGFKVFEKEHLCFILINTEWLYVSVDTFPKIPEDVSKHLKIYENCQLCAPLIKDVCERIGKEYPDFTVISVMHRPFEDLTWDEKNHHDNFSVDVVERINRISDILITGHDHTINDEPPSMIRNRLQHFRIGATGRREPLEKDLVQSAEIIRINPVRLEIERLHLQYDNKMGKTGCWSGKEDINKYRLFSKTSVGGKVNVAKNNATVFAKSTAETDIRKAVSAYIKIPEGREMLCLELIRGGKKRIMDEISRCKTQKLVIVFYQLVYRIRAKVIPPSLSIVEADNFIKEVRDALLEDVLSNRIWMCNMHVEVYMDEFDGVKTK